MERDGVDARRGGRRKVVLFDSFGGRYSDNPRAISEALARRGAPVERVWVVAPGTRVPADVTAVTARSARHVAYLREADAIVANDVLPYEFERRDGGTHLQTWHGTPLKRIAYDVPRPSFPGSKQHYDVDLGRDVARWDVLLSPNRFSTEILPRAFRYGGDVAETGYPRNDLLLSPEREHIRARVREELGIADGVRAALYLPTWRDGDYFSLALDADEVRRGLGDSCVVLVRAHNLLAQTGASVASHPALRDVTAHEDVRELYLAADVLITDYSSAMFDFAVTRKPIVFYVYDLERYRDELRGFYFDLTAEAPGPLVRTTAELVAELRDPDAVAARHEEPYARFRERFCHREDGRASERAAELLLERLGQAAGPRRPRLVAGARATPRQASAAGPGTDAPAAAAPPAVIVLAAGRGSRLGHAGADVPKWLVDVAGRPIAHFHLAALRSVPADWSRLVAVTGHRSDALDAERLSALAGRTCELVYNPEYATVNNWLSLALGLDHLASSGWDGAVCVLNSDLLLPPARLQEFLRCVRGTPVSLLVTDSRRPLTLEAMKVVTGEDASVSDIGKGELRGTSTAEFIGLSAVAAAHVPAVRAALADLARDPGTRDEWYEGAYRQAIDAGVRFRAFEVGTRDWVEIDDERDLRLARDIAGRYAA